MTLVDDFLKEMKIKHLDILKIDAEGNDGKVSSMVEYSEQIE